MINFVFLARRQIHSKVGLNYNESVRICLIWERHCRQASACLAWQPFHATQPASDSRSPIMTASRPKKFLVFILARRRWQQGTLPLPARPRAREPAEPLAFYGRAGPNGLHDIWRRKSTPDCPLNHKGITGSHSSTARAARGAYARRYAVAAEFDAVRRRCDAVRRGAWPACP